MISGCIAAHVPASHDDDRVVIRKNAPDLVGATGIELGGEAAAIVPLAELRRLQAVTRRAPAELLEEAEIEATLAAHREWVAAGRPGAVSHDEAMAELLGRQ
jgi:hypothetical protein